MRDGRHSFCKSCHDARCRETRERLYGGSRHYHLMRRYGIGSAEVDAIIESQDDRARSVVAKCQNKSIMIMRPARCVASCASTATAGSDSSGMIRTRCPTPSGIWRETMSCMGLPFAGLGSS